MIVTKAGTDLVTSCVETAFWNRLLKGSYREEVKEGKEVDVSSYWMMERDTEKWREDKEVDVSSYWMMGKG